MTTGERPKKIDLYLSVPFFIIHALALGVLLFPFSWKLVALCAASYFVRMFFITAGYHRYFSHRAFKTGRVVQFLLAFGACTSAQKGALWWAANHRHHHRYSDKPEDLHSPIQDGFWWSHVGWILSKEHTVTMWDQIQDFAKFPELVWLNRYSLTPAVAYAVAIFLVGGWAALFWGFFLSTTLLWHGTFTINSLSHVFGSRRYTTTDTSRNNALLAALTLGEGWHNNHHTYPSSANQGFFWWEIDVTHLVLKAMSRVGLVHDLRKPPVALLEAKRIRKKTEIKSRSSAPQTQTTTPPDTVSSTKSPSPAALIV